MDQTAGQDLAFRKNEFYRNAYRRTMKWLVSMLFIGVCLSLALSWMTYHRTQPAYYAAVMTGQVVKMHSLSEPIVTNAFITQWAALLARRIFNLNFSTYQQQLNEAQDRFTSDGWEKMLLALKNSGLITNLVQERLIMSSVVSGTPVILGKFIIHGRYTWRVQMPLLVKFTSASAETQRNFIVTMSVQRVSTLNASQSIQVTDFAAAPVQ